MNHIHQQPLPEKTQIPMGKNTLDLGVVGNCTTAALIDKNARLVWMCFPRLDGDPIFNSLLGGEDAEHGFFDIELSNYVGGSQRYITNTAILETILEDKDGNSVRIVDYAPRFKRLERIFRPAMHVRRIEPLKGRPHVKVRLRPSFGYGGTLPGKTVGSHHIRYTTPDLNLRLTTNAAVSYIAAEQSFILDRELYFALGIDEPFDSPLLATLRDFEDRTVEYWQEWVRYLSIPYEWQDVVIRSAITLKLCSFEDSGAIVAALTTSVPEAANSGRNWDYRFCWLRDAYFVVHALNRLGATRTMEEFIRYVTDVAADVAFSSAQGLNPVYGVLPSGGLDEWVAESLPGYRGMGPVRVGNAAAIQVQNDVYGSIILSAAQMFFDKRLPIPGDNAMFERLEILGQRAAEQALEPDAGIWEYRGRKRVHTHSAMMCWAACDRLARIASVLDRPGRVAHWQAHADRIKAAIVEQAWNPTLNSFVESIGGDALDASLLLMPEIGFLPPDDPKFIATVEAIERHLKRGPHMMRYAAADDFGTPETAFNVCSFWYIDALVALGRVEEARERFVDLLSHRNHLGLLSEDTDVETGEMWGNFPQTYSMVGVILCAMRLSKSWEESVWRGW